MPRPKGSKNKAKTSSIPITDFTSLIADKAAAKDALVSDIAALEENVNNLKNELKEKKVELSKLEAQKAEADAKAAAEVQKAELQEAIQNLMADGVRVAEILEKAEINKSSWL